MAFIKKNKRKTTKPSLIPASEIKNINLRDRLITDGHGHADFERLLYRHCPVIYRTNQARSFAKNSTSPIYANRNVLVINICNAIYSMDKKTRTKINIFNEIVAFFKLMDEHKIDDMFSVKLLKIYNKKFVEKYKSGVKGKSLQLRQNSLRCLLRELDFEFYEKNKRIFTTFPSDSDPILPYSDGEIKKIILPLFYIYNSYATHLENDTVPSIFPLYENGYMELSECRDLNKKSKNRTVSYRTNSSVWKSDLSRVAFFLTCFYTGVNSSPLLDLKISDFQEDIFKGISRGAYKLNTKKGRQNGRGNEISIGFNKKSKMFFERWTKICKKLNGGEDGYMFPQVVNDKLSKMTITNMSTLNKYLFDFDIPKLSSQRFRKTKASLLIRSTESIFMVAEGLNNSVTTSAKHYADGNPIESEFSLASALHIREQTALGISIDKAKESSSIIFKDPLKKSIIDTKFKKLSNGLRCGSTYNKDKTLTIKNALIKQGIASEKDLVACNKFLECFGCIHHAVIAEVDDIWLLLSFADVILESLSRPSINSNPTKLLDNVHNSLQIIIAKIKSDYKSAYNEAYEKYLNTPHPVWQDQEDLELLKGVY